MPAPTHTFREIRPRVLLPTQKASANIAEGLKGIGMAEGLLGGVLGGEEEKPEVQAPEALAGAEAFAAAVVARLSGNDPGVARKTEEFLTEQTQLLRAQKEHLNDEHALRLAHLRNQLQEEGLRRFGLRLRVGFQLFLVLVATVIGIGAAIMVRDAFNSRSVIVDSFEISPNLATQALNGHIVAAGMYDRLTQLQTATRTDVQKREISNAWSNGVAAGTVRSLPCQRCRAV
jgi:hypothetical protein